MKKISDIKLENILLVHEYIESVPAVVKIIDFGFSTMLPPGKKLKATSSPLVSSVVFMFSTLFECSCYLLHSFRV